MEGGRFSSRTDVGAHRQSFTSDVQTPGPDGHVRRVAARVRPDRRTKSSRRRQPNTGQCRGLAGRTTDACAVSQLGHVRELLGDRPT